MKKLNKLIKIISISNVYKIRDIILFFLDKTGINVIFRSINKNKCIILFGHGVSHRFINFSQRHIAVSEFEKQIKYLKKKKYTFITLSDLTQIIKYMENCNQKFVIFTFDDGFKNVVKNAYPIMKKYNAKGCIYIVSDFVGDEKLFWTNYINLLVRNAPNSKFKFKFKNNEISYTFKNENELQQVSRDIKHKLKSLSNTDRFSHLEQFSLPNKISSFKTVPVEYLTVNWDDLKSLNKNVLEIGCHTKTHPNLTSLETSEEFQQELMESKRTIENKIGYEINQLCYPSCVFNNKVIHYVKKFGYHTATTCKEGFNTHETDLFQLKRIQVKNNFIVFKAKISGLYFLIQKFFNQLITLN